MTKNGLSLSSSEDEGLDPKKETIKRHDDRMKSARYKLYRLFAIIPTWPNGSYRGNKNTAWSETCLIVCFILVQEFGLSKAEPLAHSMT
jgi:hypothetical protein